MRIAIFSDTFPPQVNGVASVVRDSVIALTELGHEVAVFTVTGADRTEQTPSGKPYAVKKLPSLSVPKFIYQGDTYAFALPPGIGTIRALKKFKPDIIHTHTPFFAGWGAVIGKKACSIPLVGTHHTFYDDYLKHVKLDYPWGKKFSWKYTIAYYNHANIVTSPSRALSSELHGHGLTRPLQVMPNPVNVDFFVPAANGAKKLQLKRRFGAGKRSLVYMGRISYEKDIDQALRAFAQASRKLPDLTFMIVGDGPERKKLEALAKELGVAGKVIFTGMLHREDLRAALQANDAFVTASRSENMPVSVIEAMACGLPIASVRARGIPEIVQNGVNGLLVEPDRPDKLAAAIVRLFSSPMDLRKKSRASRKLAEQYSQKNITEAMVGLYEKIITKKIK
ncbi:MAG: glycosyltransferase [Minisyncoccia bacterium]|jgi:1,2-diacylglycerol 3-alpha-glucosyltransferase